MGGNLYALSEPLSKGTDLCKRAMPEFEVVNKIKTGRAQ